MNDLYRQAGGGGGAGMAVIESKQTDYTNHKTDGEYWHDVQNELSPVRKHLIHTYLQIQDDEALPLMGEYFGVALSFMAMGALVRASNSSKKRRKSMSDEERLDLRACSRFQRMALESMLKEAMERLRGLAQNAYQTEERVRDLVETEMEKDKEKVVLLSRFAEAEKAVQELKALRKADGQANERVMSIIAAKEQDWMKEKRNLQKEIERLKENVNMVCREVKFQSRRCRNRTCEHCKGIDRVVRHVRGRASLRELNREIAAHMRREAVKTEQTPEVEEVEEERVLVKSLEQKKKRGERPGHLQVHDKVEKHEKNVNWTASRSSVNPSGGSAGGAGQFMTKELIVKQQQDMESELANILKRVGMLKQRSHSSSVTTVGQQSAVAERKNVTPLEDESSSAEAEAGNVSGDNAGSELTKDEVVRKEQAPRSFGSEPELELGDDLTTGLLTVEQEAILSVEEDSDLLELEKSFEFPAVLETAETINNITNVSGDGEQIDAKNLADTSTAETTEETQMSIDEDPQFAEFESFFTSNEVENLEEVIVPNKTGSEESEISANWEVSVNANAEAKDVLESEVELALNAILETSTSLENADELFMTEDTAVSEFCDVTITTDVVRETIIGTVIEADRPVLDAVHENLEECEKQGASLEAENLEETDSLTNAVSPSESCVSREQSGTLDGRQETIVEIPLECDHISTGDSSCVDREELAVAQGEYNELVSEVSVCPVDKSFAEEVKVVDAGDSSESKQVLEMVEVDSGAGLLELQDALLEEVESVESSATETDLTGCDNDAITTVEKRDLDGEIPVFERAGSEDVIGDLPEPDEKRVCDSREADVDVVEEAGTTDKSSLKCEEGENREAGDLVSPDLTAESESLKASSDDAQDKVKAAKDNASFNEQEESSRIALEVESAVGAD